MGCGCSVCLSTNPRNKRLRSSVILGLPEGNLLIDTTPDLRTQFLREGLGVAHAVAYTHEHADHLFGLDDLRLFGFYIDGPVPLYCEPGVEQRIRHSFDYAFSNGPQTHAGAIPRLQVRSIGLDTFRVLGADVQPLRLMHGPACKVLGFRIGNIAYCTDTNFIPEESFERLAGVDILILDTLRRTPHPTHFNLEGALEAIARIAPRRALLEYEQTNRLLPTGVELAYDGQRLPLELD